MAELSDDVRSWLESDGWDVSEQKMDGAIWAWLATKQSPKQVSIVVGQSPEMGEQFVVQSRISLSETLTNRISERDDLQSFLSGLKSELEGFGLEVAGFDNPREWQRIGLLRRVPINTAVDKSIFSEAFAKVLQGVELVDTRLED